MGTGATISGAAVFETLLPAAEATSQHSREPARQVVVGPCEVPLEVNGVQHRVTVEPAMTVAEVPRGSLGLTGTKIGCGAGAVSCDGSGASPHWATAQ